MKKVIVASDSFKGTLSSVRVYEIIKEVLTERYEGIEVMGIPIADEEKALLMPSSVLRVVRRFIPQ